MLFAGDASEWLLPMPVTLVALMLVFSLWRRILPRQRRLRRSVAAVVVVAFVLTSTPAIINIGVKALEGTPQTVAEQLDALGFPPDPGDDALNAQAVLTVREGKAGRKALAEGGQVDPSSHGKVAGRGRTDSSSRSEAEDFVKTVAAPGGDATAASPAGAVKPPRVRGVIVPSSGAAAPNGPQARLDQGGYMRLRAGIETWRRTGGLLVLMGGLGEQPEYSLAADMRRLAIGLGVPPEAIRTVRSSWTTFQDISGAARLIREEGGQDDSRQAVILVTSALHMQRSLAVAHQAGLDPIPVRSDYRQLASPSWAAWFPNNGAPWNARAMLHELIGVWYYRLRGRA